MHTYTCFRLTDIEMTRCCLSRIDPAKFAVHLDRLKCRECLFYGLSLSYSCWNVRRTVTPVSI